MSTRDPRIDTYIEQAAEFAQPVLRHIRRMVHQHCPEADETIKWGMPHFEYKGSIFCHFAAFKHHCALGFWLGALLEIDTRLQKAMGQFGRITKIDDLPNEKEFAQLLIAAMNLHDSGAKLPARSKNKTENKELDIPPEFLAALKKNTAAQTRFETFSYSNKKEYVAWYTEAKTETTRAKRLAQAIEWMAEGKRRNWKYEKC